MARTHLQTPAHWTYLENVLLKFSAPFSGATHKHTHTHTVSGIDMVIMSCRAVIKQKVNTDKRRLKVSSSV